MLNPSNLTISKIQTLANKLIINKQKLTVAESCTGGLLAALCTDLSGSSVWFDRGFVTYSNQAKSTMLSVDLALIEQFGAVSDKVVQAMASGAINNSNADYAISISGIAGPSGGTAEKPVGTVFFGFATVDKVTYQQQYFAGNRQQVRQSSVEYAIDYLNHWMQ